MLSSTESKSLEMEKGQFATLPAIQGEQFGKVIYASVIKFKQLEEFLSTFKNVQRNISNRKVRSIKKYIMSGLESGEELRLRFFPALTVTCRSTIYYDNQRFRVAIDTEESRLSINDGQHRNEAIIQTLKDLEDEFVKSKDKEKTTKIRKWIEALREMSVPIMIFDNLTEREEKQLFYDTNNKAQRPSRNTNIRLDQTDLVSRMARDLSAENKYLSYYGVEDDKMSIQGSNPNTVLLTTLYESIKELLGGKYKIDVQFLNEGNYESHKKYVNETFDKMFNALPPDLNVKGKYLIEKSYTIKSIVRFVSDAHNKEDMKMSDEQIYGAIAKVDWRENLEYWKRYNASLGQRGKLIFGGGMHGGSRSVYQALVDEAKRL